MRRSTFIILAVAALAIGVGAAIMIEPAWQRHRMLVAVVSSDPSERARAWQWLLEMDDSQQPRAIGLVPQIEKRLLHADDEALLNAAAALRSRNLWRWDLLDASIIFRELWCCAARRNPEQQLICLETYQRVPPDADPSQTIGVATNLLVLDADTEIVDAAFDTLLGWAGRKRVRLLQQMPIEIAELELQRRYHLAQTWGLPHPISVGTSILEDEKDTGLVEAVLLRHVLATPDDAAPVLEAMQNNPLATPPAYASILRFSLDPRAKDQLERMAEDGDMAARYALQVRTPSEDEAQARTAVNNSALPINTRRLAAWRMGNPPPELVRELLAEDLADEDGNIYAVALLAERHLPEQEAINLCEEWIRSFDDDGKRAGALLAALTRSLTGLLHDAYEIEDAARVRTLQRLALWSLNDSIQDNIDPQELAHRALHHIGGAFDPDIAAVALAAGDASMIAYLTSRPAGEMRLAVKQRAWLIERFLPTWHEAAGRPIGGNVRGIMLHFDRLDVLRVLTARRLAFDETTRTYREND